jgi:hypothetical protein
MPNSVTAVVVRVMWAMIHLKHSTPQSMHLCGAGIKAAADAPAPRTPSIADLPQFGWRHMMQDGFLYQQIYFT